MASSGSLTATGVVASSLSVGSGVWVISSSRAHLTTSAPFQAGPRGPVSGRLSGTAAWRARPSASRFPAAFPPPAFASWSSCSRSGFGRSLRSAYRPARGQAGPGRGFRVPHTRAATGVGASFSPGTAVLNPGCGSCTPGARRIAATMSLNPATTTIHAGGPLDEPSTEVQALRPPSLPLTHGPRMERGLASASPQASHPAVTGNAHRGRGQAN